jgi:hypothetical protein
MCFSLEPICLFTSPDKLRGLPLGQCTNRFPGSVYLEHCVQGIVKLILSPVGKVSTYQLVTPAPGTVGCGGTTVHVSHPYTGGTSSLFLSLNNSQQAYVSHSSFIYVQTRDFSLPAVCVHSGKRKCKCIWSI